MIRETVGLTWSVAMRLGRGGGDLMWVLPRIVFELLKCLRLSPLCPVLFGVHLQLIRAHLFYARPLPSTLEREGLRLASCFSGILSSVWPALHSAK